MRGKTYLIVLSAVILSLGLGLIIFSFSPSDTSSIDIEFLEDLKAGETATLQARSNITSLEGEKVTVNGEDYGKLNSAGIAKFNAPNTEQIKVKIRDYEEEFQVQTTEQKIYTEGINLDKKPVRGELNRLVLIKNGERLSNQTITVNGEEIGRTGGNGAKKFVVPKTHQLEIKTLEKSKTFMIR